MLEHNNSQEIVRVELIGLTRSAWLKQSKNRQNNIYEVDLVKSHNGPRIFLKHPCSLVEIKPLIEKSILKITGSANIEFHTSVELIAKRESDQLSDLLLSKFYSISFGADVAERDKDLLHYFISTKTFDRVNNGEASVVIGPKGSGKSAILSSKFSMGLNS